MLCVFVYMVCDLVSVCVRERYKNTDRPKMWFNGFNMAAGLIRGPTMQRERERECVVCVRDTKIKTVQNFV